MCSFRHTHIEKVQIDGGMNKVCKPREQQRTIILGRRVLTRQSHKAIGEKGRNASLSDGCVSAGHGTAKPPREQVPQFIENRAIGDRTAELPTDA